MSDSISKAIKEFSSVREFRDYIRGSLTQQFNYAKSEMLKAFDIHKVTQEIKGGITSKNISETLLGVSEPKNLYSFIGFDASLDPNPTDKIRKMLEESNIKFSYKNGEIVSEIYIPSAEAIFAATPMPWATGRSWAEGIELGISGLGYYLNEYRKKSRSGLGIQIKGKLRDNVKFKNIKYISEIIRDANNLLSKISI